jgi:hypothetical protein
MHPVVCHDVKNAKTCGGTPLHNKQMVIHYYRFVFVYIRGYYCCVENPTCDFLKTILSFSTFQSTVSLMAMTTLC